MWTHLRADRFHGLSFRRQAPIAGFIVDFVCHDKWLIVEIDGATHGDDIAVARDAARTRRLQDVGLRVVRYWNNDVMINIEGVLLDLASKLDLQEPPSDLPAERDSVSIEQAG